MLNTFMALWFANFTLFENAQFTTLKTLEFGNGEIVYSLQKLNQDRWLALESHKEYESTIKMP